MGLRLTGWSIDPTQPTYANFNEAGRACGWSAAPRDLRVCDRGPMRTTTGQGRWLQVTAQSRIGPRLGGLLPLPQNDTSPKQRTCHPAACPRDPSYRTFNGLPLHATEPRRTSPCAEEWIPRINRGMTVAGCSMALRITRTPRLAMPRSHATCKAWDLQIPDRGLEIGDLDHGPPRQVRPICCDEHELPDRDHLEDHRQHHQPTSGLSRQNRNIAATAYDLGATVH